MDRKKGQVKQNIYRNEEKNKTSQAFIKIVLGIIVVLVGVLFCYSIFCGHIKGEAYYGNFETFSLNENWSMLDAANSTSETINLPLSIA